MQKIQVFLCFTWGERTQAQPISLPVSHNHGPCRLIIVLLLVVRWTVTQGSEDTAVRLSIGLYNTKLRPKAIVSVFHQEKQHRVSQASQEVTFSPLSAALTIQPTQRTQRKTASGRESRNHISPFFYEPSCRPCRSVPRSGVDGRAGHATHIGHTYFTRLESQTGSSPLF